MLNLNAWGYLVQVPNTTGKGCQLMGGIVDVKSSSVPSLKKTIVMHFRHFSWGVLGTPGLPPW